MRIVTFGIAAAFAALVLQGSLTSAAAEKSQKGQTQKQHYGRGLDVAVVDVSRRKRLAKTERWPRQSPKHRLSC